MAFQEIANVGTLTGQTGSVPTTTLLKTGPLGAGMYAIWADVLVTTAGSAGTVTISVNWDNGTSLASLTSQAFSLSTVGEQAALLGNFISVANSPITYATTVFGATGNPVYELRLRLMYLG